MKIWLDDIRPPPDRDFVWCRNAQQCIKIIVYNSEEIEFISFDHDLGNYKGKYEYDNTGYFVAKYIEELVFINPQMKRFKWEVHSANPVGRRSITMAMENADKFWDEYENSSSM
jgi:hypothetical protein